MPMGTEPEHVNNVLTTSREPKGPKRSGDPGTVGDQALMDALLIVLLAWALLFMLVFSLRRHNI